MCHLDHDNHNIFIFYLVENAILALAYTVLVITGKLFTAAGARILG